MKKWMWGLFLPVLLASCSGAEPLPSPAALTATPVVSTATIRPTTPPVSVTLAPQPACDAFVVNYCITAGHFILLRPIRPPGNDRVDPTYRYGSTAEGTRDPHHGVEFPNPSGTPVRAAAGGVILFAGPDHQARYSPWRDYYGNLVVIEHNDGLFTLYAHLLRTDVVAGQKVSAGEKIGEVGRTGVAIGSHLHFEVRRGQVEDYFATRNPELWLIPARDANNEAGGALAFSLLDRDGTLSRYARITVGYYPGQSLSPTITHYLTSYSSDMLTGEENAALSDLPAGRYRIAVDMNGQILERWVEVESGRLTHVVFVGK